MRIRTSLELLFVGLACLLPSSSRVRKRKEGGVKMAEDSIARRDSLSDITVINGQHVLTRADRARFTTTPPTPQRTDFEETGHHLIPQEQCNRSTIITVHQLSTTHLSTSTRKKCTTRSHQPLRPSHRKILSPQTPHFPDPQIPSNSQQAQKIPAWWWSSSQRCGVMP